MSVYQLLDIIRNDAPFYLREQKSLKALRVYLSGFEDGLIEGGKKQGIFGELRPFNSWVAKQLGFGESTSGWCNMILSKAGSDEKAFDLFFELLDKYRSQECL